MRRSKGSGLNNLELMVDAGMPLKKALQDADAQIEWAQNIYPEVVSFRWYRRLHGLRAGIIRSLKVEGR